MSSTWNTHQRQSSFTSSPFGIFVGPVSKIVGASIEGCSHFCLISIEVKLGSESNNSCDVMKAGSLVLFTLCSRRTRG